MTYKALYREWRPKSFREVIGQDHISVTLQNAIDTGRIGHAYLFCGPRGTGKTSSAKVLAKALNCESGPKSEPCNECECCDSINKGNSLDVIEIDAASNRGIDEIRDLREKVKFAPSQSRYKVYIIDEVHMLTMEAFNALLKTLEEPPNRVVFILATTEPHKIPATILSRVQRFDFKRIGVADIVKRLKQVMTGLCGEAEDDALLLIARKAEGGMRDALSLLDQCYKPGERLELDRVVAVLGTLREEDIFDLGVCLLNGDTSGIIVRLNRLLSEGKDPGLILRELTEHLRNVLVVKTAGEHNQLVYASKEFMPRLKELSQQVDTVSLIELISLLIKAEGDLRFSGQPSITVEVTLISACGFNNYPAENEQTMAQIHRAVTGLPENQSKPHNKSPEQASGQPFNQSVGRPAGQLSGQSSDNSLQQCVEHSSEPKVPPVITNPLTLTTVTEQWKKVLELVKKTRIGTYAFLIEGKPAALKENNLYLEFKEKSTFHRDKIEQPENKKVVEQALFSIVGYPVGIKCVVGGEAINDTDEDLINQTFQIFGQELVEIKD